MDGPSLLTSWSFEPLELAPAALVAVAYAVRAWTLRRRGTPVPGLRVAVFALGVALIVLALTSPIAAFAEDEFFFFHMIQHVVLGDLAPLCLLAGLTGPLLRPLLALRAVERLRALANPVVALPLWTALLVLWHVPTLYEGAVRHSSLHALEHTVFLAAGIVVWLPVLETLPAPEWFGTGPKLGYVAAVRGIETIAGNVFAWSGTVFYGVYVHTNERWGISPEQDQNLAGVVMMAEGGVVTIVALAWLFLRLAQEGQVRQELLEAGHDARTVKRVVRYRRWEDLAGRR